VKFVAGSESARVLVLEETGQDIYAFMSDTLGSPEWLNYDLRLRRRERIDVPGAEGAFRPRRDHRLVRAGLIGRDPACSIHGRHARRPN
jgi:hypothetical protein